MEARRIPILCYHRVHADDDPGMPPVTPDGYCGHVTASVFRQQMSMLAERGFSIVSHSRIRDWLEGTEELPSGKVAAIDFDDNRLNVLENALPIMEEYGFKGTVFVISALADGCLPHMDTYPAMHWDELAILMELGWAIGAHTNTHAYLADMYRQPDGPAKVDEEMRTCRAVIKSRLGLEPANFAYPMGDCSEEVEAIVKQYCRTARLWFQEAPARYVTRDTDPYRLPAINVSIKTTEAQYLTILDGASI